jgi:hypothetical protein
MYWDEDDNTVDIVLNGYIMKVGEDQFYPVKNQTGSNIPKGTSVRFAGTVGSSGRLLIAPFLADGSLPSTRFMGVTAEAIANGEDGKVLWFGRLRGIDTSAFAEGDILYASTTVAGGFQTTVPVSPNNIVEIAAVVTDATNGTIFIRPQILQGTISIGSPANGLSLAGTVLSLGLASSGVTGALSGTDWSTFNGKIGGTIASGQVAFGTGVNTVGGDSGLTWDNVNKRLGLKSASPLSDFQIGTATSDSNLLYRPLIIIGGFPSTNVRSQTLITFGATTTINADPFSDISGEAFKNFHIGIVSDTSFRNLERFSIVSGGVERLSIIGGASNRAELGRVGIATNSPTNTLDVNGTTRIRTISNLGSTATRFLVASATGVISERTGAEMAADIGAVTITGTQTITGAKTFNNALLLQQASNPVLRIRTTDNTSIINFANAVNEDGAGIEMSTPSNEFAIVTRVSNKDIRIQPHGTGKIKLPNVPSGSGDVLMRDGSNNLVVGSAVIESTGTFTPTLISSTGSVTYTFTTQNASYVKIGKIVYFSISLTSISSSGTSGGEFRIGGLPFSAENTTGQFYGCEIIALSGSSFSKDALLDLRGIISPNNSYIAIDGVWSTWSAPTYSSSGTLRISGFYKTSS